MNKYPYLLVRPDGKAVPVRDPQEEMAKKANYWRDEQTRKTRRKGESRLQWWRRVRKDQNG